MTPYIITHYIKALFTGDHNDGTIEVSSTDAPNLWPGATAYVGSSTKSPVEVLILEDILPVGHFRVRLNDTSAANAGGPVAVPVPGAGSDLSAFTVADGAYIIQIANQYIFPYTHDGVIPRTPSGLYKT